jgi:alpha-glucosidase
MVRAFPMFHEWGIEGVMIDFMDSDDQQMVVFQRELLRLAAANRLTVTFHGVAKPTGLERTYPNLLTSEGVLNLEYDKWEKLGVPPEHEVTVPFTRMLAGPLDFHQGSFRAVPVGEFQPRVEAPLVMGTPSRTLASYVVLQNHLSMVADYPSAYRGHPALPILAQIPTTWNDTKVVDGMVGEFIIIARRQGSTWWIGAMTNREPRTLRIPLNFLGTGRFRSEIHSDDLTAPYHLARQTADIEPNDALTVSLVPAGGSLIRLSPITSAR